MTHRRKWFVWLLFLVLAVGCTCLGWVAALRFLPHPPGGGALPEQKKESVPLPEKILDDALSRAREHLRILILGGRYGDVTIRVEAGRLTFVDRFEREKLT